MINKKAPIGNWTMKTGDHGRVGKNFTVGCAVSPLVLLLMPAVPDSASRIGNAKCNRKTVVSHLRAQKKRFARCKTAVWRLPCTSDEPDRYLPTHESVAVDDFINHNGDHLGELTQVSSVCISQYFV